jgi:maltose alpha-D-glucosyltransferase/alpha-amylase
MPEKPDTPAQPYPAWLEEAVFYQVYPPSFFDSDGDGIGDIPGMCQKLDYLHWLGVNALWLNPCFASPFQDGGYDVSDYYQVAPRYGTNADLERLFVESRARGMHIFLDLVPGHTSWEHPWFKASARHERNPYSDWFIWTHRILASSEGLNAVMGLYERDGSYITSFFACQPALNYGFASPEPGHPWQQPVDAPGPQAVRQEIKNIMRFWLEKGASGFRVDMAGSLVKNDPGRRETARFWREVRAWLDAEFPQAALISEWGSPAESLGAGFHMDFLLHFGRGGYNSLFRKNLSHIPGPERYTWSFFDRSGHGNIREFLDEYLPMHQEIQGKGLVCIPSGNHDMGIRLSEGRTDADLAVVWAFLLTMPGAPFIYYGDEIGMRTVHGLASTEGSYDRTGCRTPMQWDNALPNAGFSLAGAQSLYLPIDPSPSRPTVAQQMADPGSLLNQMRDLVALRKAHPALHAGSEFAPLYAEAGHLPFVFERRSSDGERIVVALNPAAVQAAADLPGEPCLVEILYGKPAGLAAGAAGWQLRLPPVSAGIYRIR